MKKNILCLFSLFTLLAISGCEKNNNSNSINNSNSNNPNVEQSNSSSIDDSKIEYRITVVLDDGSSVGADVRVQLCKLSGNGLCTPTTTDSQGVAVFNLEPASYSVDKIDYDGYALEPGLKVDENNASLTVVLKKILTPTSGDGTENAPYVINQGVYQTQINSTGEIKNYVMTFEEVGNYVVESWSSGTLVDPKVISFDDRLEVDINDPLKKDVKYGNFKCTFEIKEENLNIPYEFSISNEGEFSSPKEYIFALKKI